MDTGKAATGKLGSYAASPRSERSIADVLKDIASNLQVMVRSELRLARLEATGDIQKLLTWIRVISVAAIAGVFGLGFLLLSAMFGLELALPNWAAALVVGGALAILSLTGLALARHKLKTAGMMDKTVQTVKEDVSWMKEQVKS